MKQDKKLFFGKDENRKQTSFSEKAKFQILKHFFTSETSRV